MALLFVSGAEWNDYSKWDSDGGSLSSETDMARSGLDIFGIATNETNYTRPLSAVGGFVFGAAVMSNGWGTASLLQAREDVYPTHNTHLSFGTITTNLDTYFCVRVGSTIVATGTKLLRVGTWYHVEFKGVIHSTTGSFEVRINGVSQAELTMSGLNTRNGGTGQWNRFGLSGATFDDIYVCDMSGPQNNNFLGMVTVISRWREFGASSSVGLIAQTDAVAPGTTRTLTPSTGTDHGANADEPSPGNPNFPANLPSGYNYSATPGAKDTYNFPPLTAGSGGAGAIYAVCTNLYGYRSDLHTRRVCHVVRTGTPAADYDGPNVELSNQWELSQRVWEVNPATSAPWTEADINAMEAGMKVTE